MSSAETTVRVAPANQASWEHLQRIFGTRGQGTRCQCQRYRLQPGETFANFPAEERAYRLHDQTCAGDPTAQSTSGLVAFLGDEPVGWCAVGPRSSYDGLVRHSRVAWDGRDEDRSDPDVWAVTCVFTRAGFRKLGVSRTLIAATVDFAKERGARALEGYPMLRMDVIAEELHVGTLSSFVAAGFAEIGHPSVRRAVVRIDF